MTMTEELLEHFSKLDVTQQRHILDVVRTATQTSNVRGESGQSILQSARLFDAQSLDEMETAINQGCEGIDWHDWA